MSKKHLMAKTTSNLPIVTKTPTTEDCCNGVCQCPVCLEDKQLNKLFYDKTRICNHSVCKDCIRGIISSNRTELPECPLCRKPFTHFGCSKLKDVSKYVDSNSSNPYPQNTMMYSMHSRRGGRTRRLRRRRTNKRK